MRTHMWIRQIHRWLSMAFTLAVIAKTNNAKVQDIINANKISDPTKIRVGQTLFIPQGK